MTTPLEALTSQAIALLTAIELSVNATRIVFIGGQLEHVFGFDHATHLNSRSARNHATALMNPAKSAR